MADQPVSKSCARIPRAGPPLEKSKTSKWMWWVPDGQWTDHASTALRLVPRVSTDDVEWHNLTGPDLTGLGRKGLGFRGLGVRGVGVRDGHQGTGLRGLGKGSASRENQAKQCHSKCARNAANSICFAIHLLLLLFLGVIPDCAEY